MPVAELALTERMELWIQDHRTFAEDLLVVQTPELELVPFKFNNVQVALDEIMKDIEASGRFKRLIIDKLRRAGCSSWADSRGFHAAVTRHNHYSLLIAHEPEATDTIFGMTKRFYGHMPDAAKPRVLYDNRKALTFNTKSRVGGLDSEIKCGTAGKENFGSSQLVNFLHASEFSKWPAHIINDLMTSLMPTIPKTEDSEIIIESTANGIGNKYHQMWLAARYHYEMYLDDEGKLAWRSSINDTGYNETNTWSRVFIPWFVFEKCAIPVAQWERQTGQTFERTAEEETLVTVHMSGCPVAVQNQKLAWYRQVLVDDFQGDVARRAQEYPTTWQESFMSNGDAAFDAYLVQAKLDVALRRERTTPCTKYDIDPMTGQFFAHPKGRLWVWEEPEADAAYAVIADVSKGIVVNEKVGGDLRHDFSEVSVKHQLSGREVAHWHGKMDPDLFGYMLVWIGRRYNEAWLVPENNGPGGTVIAAILRMKYNKLYVERYIEPPNIPKKRWGFSTQGGRDGGVRMECIDALIASVRDNRDGIMYPPTFEQMLSFKRNAKGKFEAEYGCFDDCVVLEGIAKFALPLLPLPSKVQRRRGGTPQLPAVPRGTPPMGSAPPEDGWT